MSGVAEQGIYSPITEVAFTAHSTHGLVPALAWLPTRRGDDPPPPVVLLGHGGSGHKGIDRHRRLATRLAGDHGIAALAIDGPFHGDRAVPGDGPLDYQQRVIALGPHNVHQRMSQDWLSALSVLAEDQPVDSERIAFLGLSMGARYGLALCAQLGARLVAAVIGKFGLASTDGFMTAMAATDLNRSSAAVITAPVLQHVQWDDEVFARAGQLELFDHFASPEKVLRARGGLHHHTRDDDEDAWLQHLVSHLLGPRTRADDGD
ncbi:dienelactone hydrolase family protein [Ornithinimicrobium sp. Y1694]|uniref:dienelactone hydrolase family protein n=1 Tax=Ornithinimicrobium sp. Y1694 TaxID=3418590 RepID=UPI003CEBC53F